MIKLKALILFISFFSLISSNYAQINVGRTTMDYEVVYGNEILKMNGAGTRSLFFIELYSAALYLQEKSSDPISIAYENETMAIKIEITSELISRETMISKIEEGFVKATGGNTSTLESRIAKIREYYQKELSVGDKLDLVYIKDKGVVCYYNDKELGVIEGQDFKFALYKIWLGEEPASKSLKEGMLNKS